MSASESAATALPAGGVGRAVVCGNKQFARFLHEMHRHCTLWALMRALAALVSSDSTPGRHKAAAHTNLCCCTMFMRTVLQACQEGRGQLAPR
jgi:hypothetical protein